ncbi:glutamate--tRNA ligase [Sporolituus thermophilus]|uniref:Glutamate--tRNA ligase n=1 Tax=Sporolituus thermophilus DSM 23256 TaxID=1123285 RepID=A0A1G7PHF4_9FIRM|nr:glutamate--tRNA ligase [Sporolituus thermophilus]SDF85667.1 nondiscriminating glutamyl-tRNA synthetase [Sporolituus thermophilus DSM 23256]
MSKRELRVRFAPSPTGPFHIGGARSALFNWLLAKKHGGKMILRIEDTDLERSSKESEENIKEALRWLGIQWDEGVDVGGPYGPYRQTERLDIYRQYTDKLIAEGKAYLCYCTDEELEAERQAQLARGETPRYSGRCAALTEEERRRLVAEGRKPAVRFRVPENRQIVFKDLVRGVVTFDSNGIGDFVILKSDGIPVYNYAVVIDDALMRITHVIRAEEHLSNTPRQILLYEALGFELPEFGHISLILGKDRTKMSKRHGATSVEQYRQLGYLPEGLVNFLALLGWSPANEQEFFTIDELVREFSMDRVAKNPAVFDLDKLNYINAHYIRRADPALVTELALPHLQAAGYVQEPVTPEQRTWLVQVVAAVQDYISYAAQVVDHVDIFFKDEVEFESDEARQVLADPDIPRVMAAFKSKLDALQVVDAPAVQAVLKGITKELKVGGKKVYMPIRVALTGRTHGLDLDKFIALIGKERTLVRLQQTLAKIGL